MLTIVVQVPFPIAKILHLPSAVATRDESACLWVCVGVLGQTALFRGKQLDQKWAIDTASSMAVDLAIVLQENPKQQYIAVVAPERIRLISVQAAA